MALGPPGKNGRRLKTDREKEITRLEKAAKEKNRAREARDRLQSHLLGNQVHIVRCFLSCDACSMWT